MLGLTITLIIGLAAVMFFCIASKYSTMLEEHYRTLEDSEDEK